MNESLKRHSFFNTPVYDQNRHTQRQVLNFLNLRFHADEILACFLLKCIPKYQNAEIIRSRDPKVLEAMDIVVDVGGIYDPSTHRYDHHQVFCF